MKWNTLVLMPSSTLPEHTARPLATKRPGSQSSLRRDNELRILEKLRQGPQTQAILARSTGLSVGTVSNVVKKLINEGHAYTEPTISSGRRALNVVLESQSVAGLGIDFGPQTIRLALTVPGNEILAEICREIPEDQSALELIDHAAKLLDELLTTNELPRSMVSVAAVSIATPINQHTGLPANNTILPQWADIDIAQALRQKLNIPTVVDNDANLAALAESSWGEIPGVQQMFYVKLHEGIGAGLIFDGKLYYGHTGVTGEIGHAPLDESGPPCRCGNRGCLETRASTRVMLERLRDAPDAPKTVEELIAQANKGNHAVLRVVEDTGLAVGRVLGFISSLINPELIVIGGPLAPLGQLLLEAVRRGHARHTTPNTAQSTQITVSSLGSRAEVLGAALMALQHAQQAPLPLTTRTAQG